MTKMRLASPRPPLEKYYIFLIVGLIGYMMADLGVLYVRPMMLPTEAPPVKPQRPVRQKIHSLAEYNVIAERDIFNEDGIIPPPLANSENDKNLADRPAVPSQLPITLLGTIVHINPKMSIATVSLTSKSMSSSYKVDEEIEGMAKVTKIERKKLTFMNLNNRRMEYIDIPEDQAFNFDLQTKPSTDIVQSKDKFNYAMKRSDFDGMTQNLGQLLQQARMEPVFSPDGIGVEGFRFANIQPGSIYEKLGFKVGDMIKSVNGEPVNSPTKAMEMYNLLKTSNNVQLGIDRDGQDQTINYTIQ